MIARPVYAQNTRAGKVFFFVTSAPAFVPEEDTQGLFGRLRGFDCPFPVR
jgi:hypothetical protein